MPKRNVTMKQHLTAVAYLSREKKTFLNMTKSVEEFYGVKNSKNASSMGSQLLGNPHFTSYLEALAEEMGIGIKVRLGMAAEVAKGQLRTRTITRTFVKDDRGKLVLESRAETESDPSANARIRALRAIGTATGHDEAVKRDDGEAKRELEEMYADTLTPEILEEIESAIADSQTLEK